MSLVVKVTEINPEAPVIVVGSMVKISLGEKFLPGTGCRKNGSSGRAGPGPSGRSSPYYKKTDHSFGG